METPHIDKTENDQPKAINHIVFSGNTIAFRLHFYLRFPSERVLQRFASERTRMWFFGKNIRPRKRTRTDFSKNRKFPNSKRKKSADLRKKSSKFLIFPPFTASECVAILRAGSKCQLFGDEDSI